MMEIGYSFLYRLVSNWYGGNVMILLLFRQNQCEAFLKKNSSTTVLRLTEGTFCVYCIYKYSVKYNNIKEIKHTYKGFYSISEEPV